MPREESKKQGGEYYGEEVHEGMRRKEEWGGNGGRFLTGILLGLLRLLGILSESSASGQPPENWTGGIAYDVASAAQITRVSFYLEKTEAGPMLIYEVGVQNVSEKATRFKVTIYPLEGDPVAGYYPLTERKGKPLALEPKEVMVLKWPVYSKEMPKGFAMMVKEEEE